MAKRIIIILLFAIITSIPVAFLMDAIFVNQISILSGSIGFALVSALAAYYLTQHEKIKSKSTPMKVAVFCATMFLYIVFAWLVFIGFVIFTISFGMRGS
jgi:hypothetical protein